MALVLVLGTVVPGQASILSLLAFVRINVTDTTVQKQRASYTARGTYGSAQCVSCQTLPHLPSGRAIRVNNKGPLGVTGMVEGK